MSTIIDSLVTDRTAADVALAKELSQKGVSGMSSAERTRWLKGLKGSYNYTDLNRVNEAMAYLVDELDSIGYMVPGYEAQEITWADGDIPRSGQLAVYLANVQAIRDRLPMYPESPELPEAMEGLTFEGANAIEKVLSDVESIIYGIMQAWFYSGDIYGGEL